MFFLKYFKSISLFSIITILSQYIYSQDIEYYKQMEDSLNRLSHFILYSSNDNEKNSTNEILKETLYSTLTSEESFLYNFDSLKNIKVLIPEDKSFKIFTWFIRRGDGVFENFGLIQTYNDSKKNYLIYPLIDKSDLYPSPENMVGDADNWFGAVYYKIITQEINKKKYYTLLGWDGNNRYKQRKIIEVLTFKNNGNPVFGSKVFKKYINKNAVRVIFEHSANSVMSLKFETQYLDIKTNKRDPVTKQYIFKKKKAEMIVFDRLLPINDSMKDIYEFYVPETNLQDAFLPIDGKWQFKENVDARNPINKKTNTIEKKFTNKNKKHYSPKTNIN